MTICDKVPCVVFVISVVLVERKSTFLFVFVSLYSPKGNSGNHARSSSRPGLHLLWGVQRVRIFSIDILKVFYQFLRLCFMFVVVSFVAVVIDITDVSSWPIGYICHIWSRFFFFFFFVAVVVGGGMHRNMPIWHRNRLPRYITVRPLISWYVFLKPFLLYSK